MRKITVYFSDSEYKAIQKKIDGQIPISRIFSGIIKKSLLTKKEIEKLKKGGIR